MNLFSKILLIAFVFFFSFSARGQDVRQQIDTGSGSFSIEGGFNNENDSTIVHYYKPEKYQPDFSVIIVLPGGGRNGDTYRDTWIDLAEEYGLLVLSPSYKREFYPKVEDYNLGSVEKSSLIIGNSGNDNSNEEWIFEDFDRIFEYATQIVGSTANEYDIFGHSSGGQIAHRLAIFNPNTKANRIVAANSGWYTLPEFEIKFPYGLKKVMLSENSLKKSFNLKLIVLLGELDNENETRGHLRKTKQAKAQGSGRLARGNFFYDMAKKQAQRLECDLLWRKEIGMGVGHSYRKMGRAAARYLYSTE